MSATKLNLMPLAKMSFNVIKPGFLATVQDYGRFHHGKYGISQCGVMDEHAYCWANYLLNNHFFDAVLEITFGGVQLCAQADTVIVLTGADLDFKINDKPAPTWHTVPIFKGDILSLGNLKSGVRNYLAVKGGFKSPVFFGSKSVNLREHIGEKLTQNTILPYAKFINDKTQSRFIEAKYRIDYNQDIRLRLLPSYQFNDFSSKQQNSFFHQNYYISNKNDRTGMRLNGKPIMTFKNQLISEAMSYGSVEIAADGLPIILLKDAPTIGGYLKIGTVFSLDLPQLAQAHPNTQVRFELIDITQAQQKRVEFNRFFHLKTVNKKTSKP